MLYYLPIRKKSYDSRFIGGIGAHKFAMCVRVLHIPFVVSSVGWWLLVEVVVVVIGGARCSKQPGFYGAASEREAGPKGIKLFLPTTQ